jgi:hypothetical protein
MEALAFDSIPSPITSPIRPRGDGRRTAARELADGMAYWKGEVAACTARPAPFRPRFIALCVPSLRQNRQSTRFCVGLVLL